MLPIIKIDYENCTDPYSCYKCLLVCPSHVLGLGTNVATEKFRETDPEHFIVAGVRLDKCTGCMDCVQVCPQNAINVSYAGGM